MSLFFKLLEPIRARPWIYLKGVIIWIVIIGSDLICIFILQKIAFFVQYNHIASIKHRSIALAGIGISSYVIKYLMRGRRRPTAQIASEAYLRNKYLKKIVSLQNSYLEKLGTGKLIDLVKGGIDNRRRTLELVIQIGVEFPLKIIFSFYMVSLLGQKALAIYTGALCIMFGFSYLMNSKAQQKRGNRKEIEMSMTRRFIRFLMARLEIIQSNHVEHEIHQQIQDSQKLGVLNFEVNTFLNLMYQTPIMIIHLLGACIGWYAYNALQAGTFEYATFTGLISVMGYMGSMIIYMNSKLKDATKDFVHIERLRKQIDEAPIMENFDSGNSFHYRNGSIEIKNLCFRYNEGNQVFDNFSLKIEGGKKIAFIGNSGSGKSTLVKLISGLLSPDSGQVFIDGQDLSTVSLKSFYHHIGFLQQEPIIFDATVRENILYGLSLKENTNSTSKNKLSPPDKGDTTEPRGFDEEQLSSILQKSQCHFVYDLPQGLDTEVGERGVRLSGGQKQRLAIARIFAKNPNIIILDEPTSALDSFAEEEITKALHELCKDKTVLIIAHRLQTVKEADEIIVLDSLLGRREAGGEEKFSIILERGTHDELVAKEGHYAKMLKLQAGF